MAAIPATSERRPLITPGFLGWMAFVGVLILIGLGAAFIVFSQGLVVTNLTNIVPWGLWITIDLSAIALGAGAFTLSAVVYVLGVKRFRPMIRLAVYLEFIGYTTALLTLVMDIGRPDRFWHPWAFWNVHSVLWEITWCITLYLIILVIEFLPVIANSKPFRRHQTFGRLAHTVHRAAPALAVIGLGISLLHQSSLGATYGILKARPIWFKPSMPIMFIISAVSVGPAVSMAAAIVLAWALNRKTVSMEVLRTIARFSGLGLLLYAYIKFWDLAVVTYYGGTPLAQESFRTLGEFTPYTFGFWVGEILLGIVLPVVIFLSPRFNRRPGLLVLGAALAAFGIVVNRWNVTVSGLVVPLVYNPGAPILLAPSPYQPALIEWAVVLGVIGYALLMFTLGGKFLPLFGESAQDDLASRHL